MKYVKIFKYVKGAHVKGSGIIDIPLVTNQGRNFTYRQESVNGDINNVGPFMWAPLTYSKIFTYFTSQVSDFTVFVGDS